MTPQEIVTLMRVVRQLVEIGDFNTEAMSLLLRILQSSFPDNESSGVSQQVQCPRTPDIRNHANFRPFVGPSTSNVYPGGVRFITNPEPPQNICIGPDSGHISGRYGVANKSGSTVNPPNRLSPTSMRTPQINNRFGEPLKTSTPLPVNGGSGGQNQHHQHTIQSGSDQPRPSPPRNSPGSSGPNAGFECPYCHRCLDMNVNLALTSNENELIFNIRLWPDPDGVSPTHSPEDNNQILNSETSRGTDGGYTRGSLRDILNRLPDSRDELNQVMESLNLGPINVYPNNDSNPSSLPGSGGLSYLEPPFNHERTGLSQITGPLPAGRLSIDHPLLLPNNHAGTGNPNNQMNYQIPSTSSSRNTNSVSFDPNNGRTLINPRLITLPIERCSGYESTMYTTYNNTD